MAGPSDPKSGSKPERADATEPDLPRHHAEPENEAPREDSSRPSAWAAARPKYKKRITLELTGPALALPGELPAMPAEGPSTVFSVPEDFRERPNDNGPDGPPTPPTPVGTVAPITQARLANDAWGRGDSGVARARSRSSTPPPSNLFETPDSNDALAMVGGTKKGAEPELDFAREMQERYELGDFSGALRAAELVLGREPDHARAQAFAEQCRDKLTALYLARLGGGNRAIERAVESNDVRWLGIDHRAGFMLSQIEGHTSIEELVDISGLPRHDALKLLVELVGAGAVRIK